MADDFETRSESEEPARVQGTLPTSLPSRLGKNEVLRHLGEDLHFDEALARQLPLPLAQLYRRAHNAKSAAELHNNAYFLWEAGLKLLASAAIAEYARSPGDDPALAERLQNLARPSLGHWLEFVRLLLPVLADRGLDGYVKLRDLLLGGTRTDLPRAAGLDALLVEVLEGKSGARAQVRMIELWDRLVRHRNAELGHGAAGQKPAAHYERLGRALLAAGAEVFGRLDLVAGGRLVYIGDLWQSKGVWLVPRFELIGETPRRIPTLELTEARGLPQGDRVYLDRSPGQETIPELGALCSLHPMVMCELEAGELLFLNARRKEHRLEYLCYTTGRRLERTDLGVEQRALLARVLGVPVAEEQAAAWAARSVAEEPASGEREPPESPRSTLGEFELLSELGRGGMGVVYRAWQPALGRQVALKKLTRAGEAKAEARFFREIHALGRVEHANVVRIFSSGADGDQWFYAMELVDGAPLSAVCEKLHATTPSAGDVHLDTWRDALGSVCAEARKSEKPLSPVGSRQPAPEGRQKAVGSGRAGEASPAGGGEPATPWTPAQEKTEEAATVLGPDRGRVGAEVTVSAADRVLAGAGRDYVRHVAELVRQSAEAAHALHEAGIIHRDIKPGNIMVTRDGRQAVLMDLGLAQLVDEVEGRLTRTRQFVGTLRYASPQQVLAVGKLDRRGDVYSLGATLWELLALGPLFGATEQTPTPELMEKIQRQDPGRLGKHNPAVPRDLEAIVDKCLEKSPEQRYATAHDLARDLRRFLNGEPVRARPVGKLQRGWRWCRRNPALASLLAVLAWVILGSLVGLTLLYLNAEGQRALAEHREQGSRAVTKFYEDHVLAAARPKGWEGGAGKGVTLKEALDQAAPKIDEVFAGQPQLEATVRHTLGMTYWYLGQFEAANPQLEKAYEIRLKRLGPDHADTLTCLHDLSMQRWRQDRVDEAVAMSRQALEGRRRLLGHEHEDTLWTQLNLGLFLSEQERFDEAERVLSQGVEACKRTLGPDHHHTLYGQNDLGIVLNSKGKFQEGLELDRQTLEGRRRSLGPDHPDTLRSMANLAVSLWNVDKLEEAEALTRQALEARRRILGNAHTETFWSLNGLAGILADRGKLAEAEEVRRQAVQIGEQRRGPDDPETLTALTYLGRFLRGQGKLKQAEQVLRKAVAGSRRTLGAEHPTTLIRQYDLAWLLDDYDQAREAETLYRQTLAAQLRVRGSTHPNTLNTQNSLAVLLSHQGKKTEAEALFRQILEVRRRVQLPDHPDSLFAQDNLASVLAEQCQWAEAEGLYRSSLEANKRLNGTEHNSTLSSQSNLASLLRDQGRLGEAVKLYRAIQAIQQRVLGPDNPATLTTQHNVAWTLELQGKWDEAEKLYRRTLAMRGHVQGPEHPATLYTQNNLARVLGEQGQPIEADKLYRQALEVQRRVHGPENAATLSTQNSLANLLGEHGQRAAAEKLYRQTLAVQRRRLGPEHPAALATQNDLADLLGDEGKLAEAEKLFREVLVARRKTLPPDHLDLAVTLGDFGHQLTKNGRPAEAAPLLHQCLTIRQKKLPADNWRIANAKSLVGGCLARQKKFAEAEPLLVAGCQGLTGTTGASRKRVAEAFDRIIDLYQTWGKPERAEVWRKKRPPSEPPKRGQDLSK